MNCRDTLLMLSGYMDGEIDPVERMEVQRHLETCPECANNLTNARQVQTVLQKKALYEPAPAGLEKRVLAAVRAEERAQRPLNRPFVRPALGIAACAGLLLVLWTAFAQGIRANHEAQVTQQVTCSHVRSLMATHLLDVTSTDSHAVASWFNGKLDYAPPVIDLKPQGYPLQGGRLDYINDHSVAALVYLHQKHTINLFVWPSSDTSNQEVREESRHGYRICRCVMGNMTLCAVSDLSAPELRNFIDAVQNHTSLGVLECK